MLVSGIDRQMPVAESLVQREVVQSYMNNLIDVEQGASVVEEVEPAMEVEPATETKSSSSVMLSEAPTDLSIAGQMVIASTMEATFRHAQSPEAVGSQDPLAQARATDQDSNDTLMDDSTSTVDAMLSEAAVVYNFTAQVEASVDSFINDQPEVSVLDSDPDGSAAGAKASFAAKDTSEKGEPLQVALGPTMLDLAVRSDASIGDSEARLTLESCPESGASDQAMEAINRLIDLAASAVQSPPPQESAAPTPATDTGIVLDATAVAQEKPKERVQEKPEEKPPPVVEERVAEEKPKEKVQEKPEEKVQEKPEERVLVEASSAAAALVGELPSVTTWKKELPNRSQLQRGVEAQQPGEVEGPRAEEAPGTAVADEIAADMLETGARPYQAGRSASADFEATDAASLASTAASVAKTTMDAVAEDLLADAEAADTHAAARAQNVGTATGSGPPVAQAAAAQASEVLAATEQKEATSTAVHSVVSGKSDPDFRELAQDITENMVDVSAVDSRPTQSCADERAAEPSADVAGQVAEDLAVQAARAAEEGLANDAAKEETRVTAPDSRRASTDLVEKLVEETCVLASDMLLSRASPLFSSVVLGETPEPKSAEAEVPVVGEQAEASASATNDPSVGAGPAVAKDATRQDSFGRRGSEDKTASVASARSERGADGGAAGALAQDICGGVAGAASAQVSVAPGSPDLDAPSAAAFSAQSPSADLSAFVSMAAWASSEAAAPSNTPVAAEPAAEPQQDRAPSVESGSLGELARDVLGQLAAQAGAAVSVEGTDAYTIASLTVSVAGGRGCRRGGCGRGCRGGCARCFQRVHIAHAVHGLYQI